jgi:hypothetical protein
VFELVYTQYNAYVAVKFHVQLLYINEYKLRENVLIKLIKSIRSTSSELCSLHVVNPSAR